MVLFAEPSVLSLDAAEEHVLRHKNSVNARMCACGCAGRAGTKLCTVRGVVSMPCSGAACGGRRINFLARRCEPLELVGVPLLLFGETVGGHGLPWSV